MQDDSASSGAAPNRWLTDSRVVLAVTAVLLVVVGYPMLVGEVYSAGDLSGLYMPNRQFYARCLATGDSPLWFPGNFGGYYLHGTGQTGMYAPLHYVLYRFLPFAVAFNLEVWMSFPLMFAGAYLFLRRRDLKRSEALFGALLFTFSAFNIMRLRHLNALAIIARIPWVLFCVDIAARETNRRFVLWGAAGLAILNASQLLQGYPQYYWFSSMLVALYVIFLICERKLTAARFAVLVAATLVGVAGGAVQLLPTLEAGHDSVRMQQPDESRALVGSLPPRYLPQAFSGYSMKVSHNVRIYSGALLTLLSVWAVVRYKHFGKQRGLVLASAVLALLMVWMSLGEYGYYSQLQRPLPFIGDFRFPSRCLVLLTFACCILSALALGDLRSLAQTRTAPGRLAVAAILAVVAVSIAVTAVGFVSHTEQTQSMPGYVILGSIFFVIGGGLILLAARGWTWAFPLLILFAAAEPAQYGLAYAVFGDFVRYEGDYAPNHMPLNAELANYELPPETDQSYRLVGGPGMLMMTNLGWNRLDGGDGIPPNKLLDYRYLPAVQVAGAKWIHDTPSHVSFYHEDENQIYDTSKLSPLLGSPHGSWYEVPGVMPRARCVTRAQVSQDAARDIQAIDIATTALASEDVRLDDSAEPAGYPATVLEDRPGRIQVRVDAASRQLLILTESFHQGWRVDVDGRDGPPVQRVNGDLLGCVVEPGQHVVTFVFAPASVRHGLVVSVFAVTVIFALIIGGVLSNSSTSPDAVRPSEKRIGSV